MVEGLRVPAALFEGLVRARALAYERGWLPVRSVDLPVVSVGNLSVGGTGKTPMVAWLVERLRARGARPGILSRGYRSPASRGASGEEGVNDEGRMLGERLPGVPHVQRRDRVRGAEELRRAGADVIVLDDGFQHMRLARDLDVVLVDALRPYGLPAAEGAAPVRALLPRGFLREPLSALGRAHALVITRSDAVDARTVDALEAELRRHAPRATIARAVHRPRAVRRMTVADGVLRTAEELAPESLRGRSLDLLSGIGNPEAFEATARALGVAVGAHHRFPDHHDFAREDLARVGAREVLTTAKDAARLGGAAGRIALGGEGGPRSVLVLDVGIELVAGAERFEALVDALPPAPPRELRVAIHAGLHG